MKDLDEAERNIKHALKVSESIAGALGSDEWDFLKLAKKFRYHDTYNCKEGCLVCEAHSIIENSQGDIALAEYEKRRDYALDNGMPF